MYHRLLIALLAVLCLHTLPAAEPQWIWRAQDTQENEVAHFRKTFTLNGEVKNAVVAAAADCEASVSINDQQAIRPFNSAKQATFSGATSLLKQGKNVIAIRGKNEGKRAAVVVQLEIEMKDGSKQTIATDGTWKTIDRLRQGWQEIEFDDSNWKLAHSFGKLGTAPWGKVSLDPATAPAPKATAPERITLAKGFQVELLYSVPSNEQGSWVSMTVDPRGRLIVSDQDGALYRVTVGAKGKSNDLKIERLTIGIGQAQGLLYAADSLFVVVNGRAAQGSGLYRVRDTNGDDQFDEVKLLRLIKGGGEHGPHAVVLAPDGKSLYVAGGNHTKIPDPEESRVPRVWQEDQLLPRMWDAGGHAVGILAPGGWICRTDFDGKSWELVSVGYRNQYDIAFNSAGELFTYDSDMEWDIGAPWYRPTRVCHATSGSEFGWRSGSGVWPAYFPDNLPAAVDIGPGSPTGIVFGTSAKFPAKYQQALFLCDWSYGNIYAAHLTPDGASYTGEFERFASAAPLPVTDIVVNPSDGAMYFTVGGRRTQSGLYRVTYVGSESTTAVTTGSDISDLGSEARKLRHQLESFHGRHDPQAVQVAWPYLSHRDRFIRFAARTAIEHQPVTAWQDRALSETNPQAVLEAVVALARCGDESNQTRAVQLLARLDWDKLDEAQRLGLLRAYSLVFVRLGRPSDSERTAVLNHVDRRFPASSSRLNYELSRLLIYVEAPQVVRRCLELVRNASTQEESMHYPFLLRSLKNGWTLDERKEYFSWFNDSNRLRGGHSFAGFLTNAKNEASETLSDQEKSALAGLLKAPVAAKEPIADAKPRPVVHEWTIAELTPGIDQALRKRDFQRGREMFAATSCFKCHRFAGEGGIIGPDLTGVGKRFTNEYLIETLIEPSKTISDQYQASVFVTSDGRTITGKVANLSGDNLMVIENMLDPGKLTNVNVRTIEEQHPSPISMMPVGLLNTLNRDEVLDLLAYLRSGGDPQHEVFR
jgi:putative heme-binding domain-containing protein